MDLIHFLKVIILGMFEGLTEFAPISSTGHMIIVDEMWLHSKAFLGISIANTFKVVVQLGSILAVVVIFKEKFLLLLGLKEYSEDVKNRRLKISQVFVGLLPAAILGLLLEDFIDQYLFTVQTVMIGLVLGAVLMIVADFTASDTPKVQTVDQMSYQQAFLIGLVQCFSLWPGFSRSGSTISAGVMFGMSHRSAADFTFIMAVPIMLGASGLSLYKNLEFFSIDALPLFAVGFLSAFMFAYLTIQFFLKLINKIKLLPFAIYRLILAGAIYLIYF
ncbi:undecaprenyl-diphosphate phosphatase [Halobacillus sp. BBL2006]|uniref:undecaprenyl-diphosphate phosphatase n=1 Tax=Halobacillus sp. BBL2006 TaxID=1543706 RepID=UPI0005433EAE|nr:undecaprenyl-diphosphate phosphatase [Halobacillus sp. BBL2006]KHE72201.1 UDP pyrophosphate phosphatase [Halobacillus sp. BBL2006]